MPDYLRVTKKEETKFNILHRFHPETKIIKGIGGELKIKRKITPFLEQVYSRKVKAIIVLYNNRL